MGDPILILHGWGSQISGEKKFHEVKDLLQKKGFTVFTPDLPGFGGNTLKKDTLVFDDYVAFVKMFLQEKKLKKIILVGHSFGGRIAIAFTARYPELVSKLVLVSASGIIHPLSLKKRIIKLAVKKIKVVFRLPFLSLLYAPIRKLLYRSIGEMDYYKAGALRKTFLNVHRTSIIDILEKIPTPTLILWGENDTFTPVNDGRVMHAKIKNSKLLIIPHAGHKFPYEDPERFVKEIIEFIS
ncbi:MAG TPA: alpha/beta hydrolase [Candidatus Eisenbacteria bacterium]|nr:alpha/beta hydrolase [Candidatus Eisenbacteria bacterium]